MLEEDKCSNSNFCAICGHLRAMADPSPPCAEAVAQGSMPQRCSVNVKPIGSLAKPDLLSFKVSLHTSHPVTKSASRLTESVKQRLNLHSEPLFSVSIAGEQVVYIAKDMLEDFMEEMASKQQSAFEESDALAGLLSTFCDLPDADRHAAAAAGQAAAAGRQQWMAASLHRPRRSPKGSRGKTATCVLLASRLQTDGGQGQGPLASCTCRSSCIAARLQFASLVWSSDAAFACISAVK